MLAAGPRKRERGVKPEPVADRHKNWLEAALGGSGCAQHRDIDSAQKKFDRKKFFLLPGRGVGAIPFP